MKNCQAIARSEFGKVKEQEILCGDGKSWVLVGGVALCSDKMQQVINCSPVKIQIWTAWATYEVFYCHGGPDTLSLMQEVNQPSVKCLLTSKT